MTTTTAERQKATIGLPLERALQLKALAQHENLSITEVIEEMLQRAMTEGKIDDALPGFSIKTVPELGGVQFWFQVDRKHSTGLGAVKPRVARAVADMIEEVATVEPRGKKLELPGAAVYIGRKGKGLVLGIFYDGELQGRRGLTERMALDIVRLLRKAAAELEA
jgi:hypothetical protein